MSALPRFLVATIAVLISVAVAALELYAPVDQRLPWREPYFGTLVQTLGSIVQMTPRVEVRLVAIDDETIRRSGGAWPWSPDRLSALTDQIQAQKPRLLVTDWSAAESSRAPLASWAAVQLDPRLSADMAMLQVAWSEPSRPWSLPLIVRDGNALEPSFEVSTALAVAGADQARVQGTASTQPWPARSLGVHALRAGDQTWETAPDGALRLLPQGAPTGLSVVLAWRAANGEADLADTIVIVRHTNGTASGPDWSRAQGVAQLVNQMTPGRPAWAALAETAIAMFASFLVALFMLSGRSGQAAGFAIGLAFASLLTSAAVFVLKLQLLDPIAPVVFMLPAFFIGAMGAALRGASARESAAPAPSMRMSGSQVRGTERREVTVLVCKVRELEILTKAHHEEPQAFGQSVAKVVSAAADIARAHRGTIEHTSGGSMVAIFNAPDQDSRHTEHAVEAALALLTKLGPLNEELERLFKGGNFSAFNVSVGIESADALIGDLGFKAKGELSVLGSALDCARTLADRAQTYGTAILVGPGAHARTHKSFALLQLDVGELGASTKPFYALMGNPVMRANPRFKALQEGFDAFHLAYRKGSWEQASALLTQCAKLPGANAQLVALYEKRLEFLKTRQPEGWDGVLRLPVE